MKVSIITATWNSEKNIADCLHSVAGQTYQNIEHIVIDGGSTDNTIEIVKNTPSVSNWISEPDKGIYDALNKGIQRATGDIIGFVHSDDMLASNKTIANITKLFLSDKSIDGIYGDLLFVDSDNTNKIVRTWQSKPFQRKNVKNGWMPPHPTLFLKKEVYQKHGLFDISFKIAGDYDFMLRVMLDKEINLQYLPETITKMRQGGVSTGSIKYIGVITGIQKVNIFSESSIFVLPTYYKTGNNLEVDFFIGEGEPKKLIQASYSLENKDTRDREIRALAKAMDEQNLDTGYIYTYNNTEEIKKDNKTIVVTPLWKEALAFTENL